MGGKRNNRRILLAKVEVEQREEENIFEACRRTEQKAREADISLVFDISYPESKEIGSVVGS